MQIKQYTNKLICEPDRIGGHGLEVCGEDKFAVMQGSIIDMGNVAIADIDEAVGITHGGAAFFTCCVVSGAAKLILCGCGDAPDDPKVQAEEGKRVVFKNCILLDFCRRGPEVQDGMIVEMEDCAIVNWGSPNHFCDGGFREWLRLPWKDEHKWQRAFGAWAHDGGRIHARNCVFINFVEAPLWQRIVSRISHFGQAVAERGFFRALFHRDAWLSGYKRGLTAGPGGVVSAVNCYASKGVVIDNLESAMSLKEAESLIDELFSMWKRLASCHEGYSAEPAKKLAL